MNHGFIRNNRKTLEQACNPVVVALSIFFPFLILNYDFFIEDGPNRLVVSFLISIAVTVRLFKLGLSRPFLYNFVLMVLLALARGDIKTLVNSPIASMFAMILLVDSIKGNKNRRETNFLIFKSGLFICFLLVIPILTWLIEGEQVRAKGWGSGTLFALTGLYLFSLAVSLRDWGFSTLTMMLVGCLAVTITQSRGVVVMLVLFALYSLMGRDKILSRKLAYAFILVCLIGVVMVYFLDTERYIISEYVDLNQASSGRLVSQAYYLNTFLEGSVTILLFGHGLRATNVVSLREGLEFPHFDVIFVLFEGGLVCLSFYVYFLFILWRKFSRKGLFLLVLGTSLHTNLVLCSGVIVAFFVLDRFVSGLEGA